VSDEQRITPVRSAVGFSIALHLGVIALVTFGVPWLASSPPEPSPPVIEVQMAEIADKTNPPPPKAIERPEPPKPEPAKPAPPKKPEPPKQAEAAPAPEPLPLPKPKEIAKPVEKPPEPTPVPKAKPAPSKPAFDPNMLSALLDKRIKKDAPQTPPTPAPATPQRSTANSNQLADLNARLTMSELDAIRQQIERNWSVPAGAKDAANLVVRIHISLNPDGTLRGTPQIIDQSRMGEDYYRIAAESAVRAIYKSEPLKLPADKYEAWRDVTLTFDPREMLGG
jgi:outer membrane biosynthesis protein TonB